MGVLILARHGRTTANASGLLQGRVDNPLDELGHAQAAAIAHSLRLVAETAAVRSSPLRRCRETAEALRLPFAIDERWVELDYGAWDEVPVGQVTREQWASWRGDPSFTPPGGESLLTLQQRVEAACEEWAAAGGPDTVVVTHVSPIKAAVAWALGVPAGVTWRMNVAQASVTRLRLGPQGPVLTSFNEVHHLDE